MNNKRFASLLCVLAVLAIVAFLTGIAFAKHEGKYRGMYVRLQQPLVPGLENHINVNWAITPTAVRARITAPSLDFRRFPANACISRRNVVLSLSGGAREP